jgi:hypothetical protein
MIDFTDVVIGFENVLIQASNELRTNVTKQNLERILIDTGNMLLQESGYKGCRVEMTLKVFYEDTVIWKDQITSRSTP